MNPLTKNKIYFNQLNTLLKDSKEVLNIVTNKCVRFYNYLLNPSLEEYKLDKEFSSTFIKEEVSLDKMYLIWVGDSEWLDCIPCFDNDKLNNSEAINIAIEMAWDESEGGSGICMNNNGIFISDNLEYYFSSNNYHEVLNNRLYGLFGYSENGWKNIMLNSIKEI